MAILTDEYPVFAKCRNVIYRLQRAPDYSLPHFVLLKRTKLKATDFAEVMDYLVQRKYVEKQTVLTSTRPGVVYRLLNHEREASKESDRRFRQKLVKAGTGVFNVYSWADLQRVDAEESPPEYEEIW